MIKGKYFVVVSGILQTEAMSIFPLNVDVDNIVNLLESDENNGQVVSTGDVEIGTVRSGSLQFQCTPADSNRQYEDERIAKLTFKR